MLLEIAIGDAYGAGFEFVDDELIKKEHTLEKYYASRIDDLKAGQYTDDTQMTLAITEMMLSNKPWTRENITQFFIDSFQRDKRKGYAKRFYQFLIENDNVKDFLENIYPESIRNGAAMRSVPLSYIKDINNLMSIAELQARITHDTNEGVVSSQAVAVIGHYFLYHDAKKEDLKEILFNVTGEMFKDDKTDRVPCDGIETIDGVLTVLKSSSSYKEILDKSVRLGGDTDSVASIALGLASLTNQYKKDLPEFLYNELENGEYGKTYIEKLDKEFLEKFS